MMIDRLDPSTLSEILTMSMSKTIGPSIDDISHGECRRRNEL